MSGTGHAETYNFLSDVADVPADVRQRRGRGQYAGSDSLLQLTDIGALGLVVLVLGGDGGSPLGSGGNRCGGLGPLRPGLLLPGRLRLGGSWGVLDSRRCHVGSVENTKRSCFFLFFVFTVATRLGAVSGCRFWMFGSSD